MDLVDMSLLKLLVSPLFSEVKNYLSYYSMASLQLHEGK